MIRTALVVALSLAAATVFAATPATPAGANAAPLSASDVAARRAAWQAEAKQRFDAADADRDGRLDRVEVAQNERLARHFDRLDADADGELTPDELAQARRHRGGHRGRIAFHIGLVKGMDDDGDDAISRAELGDKMPLWAEQFARIDVDADGRLQHEELRAFARTLHGDNAGHDGHGLRGEHGWRGDDVDSRDAGG
jgi:Ca2+-binding EF-hand superfamily protein